VPAIVVHGSEDAALPISDAIERFFAAVSAAEPRS
jgi:hypothetical protein